MSLPQTQCLQRTGQNPLAESLPTYRTSQDCRPEVDVSKVHHETICSLVLCPHGHLRQTSATFVMLSPLLDSRRRPGEKKWDNSHVFPSYFVCILPGLVFETDKHNNHKKKADVKYRRTEEVISNGICLSKTVID
jgi:hypothetical protein